MRLRAGPRLLAIDKDNAREFMCPGEEQLGVEGGGGYVSVVLYLGGLGV